MRNVRHYCWILAGLLAACNNSEEETLIGNWVEGAELSGKPRSEAVAFTIGDTAYLGTGYDGEDQLRDFWKYTDRYGWEQMAELPPAAPARSSAVAMVIDGVAYVGTGFDGLNRLDDFWAYSPATGAWEEKARMVNPANNLSLARRDAVAYALKGKGYVATGYDGGALKDVWQYDPVSDKWLGKQSFGGDKRTEAVAFVINEKAYIVSGTNNAEYKTDFWMYDPDTDAWTPKRDISNINDESYDDEYTIVRAGAAVFVMNNKAYLCTGTTGGLSLETWEYNAVDDVWEEKREFEGAARTGAVAFTLGGRGYICAGRTSSLPLDDLYRFDPDAEYEEND